MAGRKTKVLVAVVVAVIIVALIASLAIYIGNLTRSLHSVNSTRAFGVISFGGSISSASALTYSDAAGLVGYALVSYSATNVSSVAMNLSIYTENPDFRIYLLNVSSYCYDCFNEQQLLSGLSSSLAAYGLMTNQSTFSFVGISNIGSIPNGSIVIIPSGLIPTVLMPAGNNTGITSLLNRQDAVIYVGDNFNRSIGTDGIIFSTSQQQLNTLRQYGIATAGLNSTRSRYTKTGGNFTFSNLTFSFVGGSNYGPVAYVRAGNGTLIAFSNYETFGWNNASAEARDIALSVESRFWMNALASGTYGFSVQQHANGTAGVFTTASYPQYSNASAQELNDSYAFVKVFARNGTAGTIDNLYSRVHFEQNGSLSMPGSVAQTQSVPIQIAMNVNGTALQSVSPHIDIYNRNMSYISTIPIGFFNTSTNLNIIKYTSFSLPQGSYIAILRNFYDRYYSAAFFQMGNVTITPVLLSFSNGTFVFSVSSNNYQIANATYSVELNGQYNYSGVVENGRIYYTLPKGTVVSYGNESFGFGLFGTRYTYSENYVKKIFHIPTFYIEFAIIAIVVVMLNLLLRAPIRDDYYIDVQEFPLVKKSTVKTTTDQVVNVFNRVNMMYHWHYMPLTPEEVKNGIGGVIKYNNMPVSITLQNTQEMLSYLVDKGSIVFAGNYYAPKKWVADSNHDVEYLAIFRKLRDYCVAHAMLFTDIDSSEVADVSITKSGVQIYILIYSGISGMKKISLAAGSKWYIIFINDEARRNFQDKLYEASGDEAEALKMGIYYSYVKLADTDNLNAIVI